MFDTGGVALPLRPLPEPAPTGDHLDGRSDERRALARSLAERIRPLVPARDRRLEVEGPLAPLVGGGLVRGSTVAIEGIGATSLALALVAAAASSGSWCVVVGLDDLAPVAAVEAGMDPARVAFVDARDSGRVAEVIAALVGAVDVVLVDARLPVRPVEVRRVGARARERGSVVVVVRPDGGGACGPWAGDVVLAARAGEWTGAGRGDGHLRSRTVTVDVAGRGRAAQGRRHDLRLPG